MMPPGPTARSLLVLVLAGLSTHAAGQAPGGIFQVNTTPGGSQPSVAADPAGNFVVVWTDGGDGDLSGISGQRFDVAGNPVGPEFRVNVATTGRQGAPRIAMSDSGEFVVVWHRIGNGAFGRRFDPAANPTGPEFPLTTSPAPAEYPRVAVDPRGGFVVSWHSYDSPAERWNVHVRRFDAAGNPAAPEFLASPAAADSQFFSTVAVDAAGGFVVGWHDAPYSFRSRTTQRAFVRRFDASDAPLSGAVQVNTSYWTSGLDVGIGDDGDFVVTWARNNLVKGRAFDAGATAVGPEFAIASDFSGYATTPSLAMDPANAGEFVVVWEGADYFYLSEDYANFRIEGVTYDRTGHPVSPQLTVRDTRFLGDFGDPVVATSLSGQSVVSWSDVDIFARLLRGARLAGVVTNAETGEPVAGATVAIQGSLTVTTAADGTYAAVLAAGTHDVSVSRHGYASASVSVTVALGATTARDFALAPVPVLESGAAQVEDAGTGGNANGVVDPNERFRLRLTVHNSGAGAATNVSATLTTSTPQVAILQPSTAYPDVASGGQATGGTPFELVTSPQFVRGTPIRLDLVVSTAQGAFTVPFTLATGTTDNFTFSATGPVDIPDRARTGGTLEIPVSGIEGAITKVAVRLYLPHPVAQDIYLDLIAPDGTTVKLIDWWSITDYGSNFGTDCPADGNDTSFSDTAPKTLPEGRAPYRGAFRPAQPLSVLNGRSGAAVNGMWKLRALDVRSRDTLGRIECAKLVIDGYVPATGGHEEVAVAGVVRSAADGAPLADATVKTSTGFSTVTGPDGRYTLDVLPGTFDVFASSSGHTTAIARGVSATTGATQTVDFALAPVVLSPSAVVVDDHRPGGNGNGTVDLNERFRLSVTLANSGQSPATGVSATLSTLTPEVVLSQASSTYAAIPAGGSAVNNTPFELQTSPAFAAGTLLELQLTVTTAQGTVSVPVVLQTGTPLGVPMVTSATGPVPITADEVNPATLELPISGLRSPVAKVVVTLHVKHTHTQDLALVLESPDGRQIHLVDRLFTNGRFALNYGYDCPADGNDTTFDDEAPTWISQAPTPRPGSYRPEQPLATFVGADPNGTWKLRAYNTDSRGTTGTLECARLLVYGYASGEAVPADDLVFADGFESGDLSAWDGGNTDGGDLHASAAAALAGTYGLAAVADDIQALYARDLTPADEPRYRARFYLDPNGFDPGEAGGTYRVVVFIGLEEGPARRLIEVILKRRDGVYSLAGRVTLDDGRFVDTAFVPIADAPHVVELDWTKATAPGANDGSFRLWVDGFPAPALVGLDNDEHALDFVRLGAMAVKPGASGTLHLDRFESRRETYIGP